MDAVLARARLRQVFVEIRRHTNREVQAVKKNAVQFSLQSLLICCIVGTAFFALNLRSTVTSGDIFLSMAFPPGTPGNPNMADWMMIERGFPLRYQQSRELYPYGTLRAKHDGIATSNSNLWSVTHGHWLIADAFFGLSLTILCVWIFPFAIRYLRWPRRGRPSTNKAMHTEHAIGGL